LQVVPFFIGTSFYKLHKTRDFFGISVPNPPDEDPIPGFLQESGVKSCGGFGEKAFFAKRRSPASALYYEDI
jgi:hypothetical protein